MKDIEPGSMVHKSKLQKVLILLLGIGLVYFYGRNVSSLHTLLELPDEAVYLWNAAYFTGTDWRSFEAVYAYYGYGYSVLLMPLFCITNNGVQLIQGSYIINILCVVGMYFVIIKLLMEMNNKRESIYIPVAAFCACLMPYIATSTLKVICEVFLSFWYCLVILVLYYYIRYKKIRYAVILGICDAFAFFIHTRAVVVVCALVLTLFLVVFLEKREYIKVFAVFLLVTAIAFVLLYLIKQNIIDYKNSFKQLEAATVKERNMTNIIDFNYIFNRFKSFDPKNYFACFCTKIVYSVYATGSIILPGFICMVKQIYVTFKNRIYVENTELATSIVKLYVMLAFVLMLVACTIGGGTGQDIRYAVYGRYYEYTLPVLLSFSICFFENEKMKTKEILLCAISFAPIGIWAYSWCTSFLTDQRIWVDTCRIAAFSKAVSLKSDLRDTLWYIILTSISLLIYYAVVYKKKYGKWMIIIMTLLILYGNTCACINTIHEMHDSNKGDTVIAEYLLNTDSEKIYMIHDNSHKYYYLKMQVLLKDRPVVVIYPDDNEVIENGDYVLTYSDTNIMDSLSNYKIVMKGSIFVLYQKGNEKFFEY